MLDRLRLTPERIHDMAEEISKIASLEDPIGQVEQMWKNADGLLIGKNVSHLVSSESFMNLDRM